jgi:hypothetical protein
MDEFDLTKRALGEPGDDPEALDSIRARLDDAIREHERRRRRRRVIPAAAAIAIASAVVAVIIGPFGRSVGAASELRRLGMIASSRAAPAIGADESLLMLSEELRPERTVHLSGPEFTVESRLRIRTWIAPDGSGVRRTDVVSSRFATEADRLAWEEAGRPTIPEAGDVREETLGHGGFYWVDTQRLPRGPGQLLAEIRSGSVARVPSSDEDVFLIVGELLSQGDAPSAVREALFEVAARLPGTIDVGSVADPLGREGVAVAIDGARRTQLVFDPATANLLAIELYGIEQGSVAGLDSWIAVHPPRVVGTPPKLASA